MTPENLPPARPEPPEPPDRLMALAAELRKDALAAGRADVAAKADQAILLLAGEPATGDRGNIVLRVLDGLGF
jgi:hypothetical protein